MVITFGKILSILIALAYVLIAITFEGWRAIQICIPLMLPIALIWFPEEIGSYTGSVGRGGNIDQASPSILISILGWFFLVGMPLILAYVGR